MKTPGWFKKGEQWFKSRRDPITNADLKKLLNSMAKTQAELTADLKEAADNIKAANVTLTKVTAESTKLLADFLALKAIIDAGGTIGQELQDAAADVLEQAKAVKAATIVADDVVVDAAAP
jgi:hypothetical protein